MRVQQCARNPNAQKVCASYDWPAFFEIYVITFSAVYRLHLYSVKTNAVGIPVCVYDAEPDEPLPLYMRSGLCFLCQRNLNEERRTDRKRPPKESGNEPGILYAIGPTGKKLKISGNTIQLKDDAIIINGAVKGIRPCVADYGFREIAPELKDMVQEATDNTTLLLDAFGGDNPESTEAEPGLSVADFNEMYDKAFQSLHRSLFLLTQWKASYDTKSTATASASAVAGKSNDPDDKMAPLLFAAGQEIDHQELMEQVQAQVDQQIQQAELAEQANQAKK